MALASREGRPPPFAAKQHNPCPKELKEAIRWESLTER